MPSKVIKEYTVNRLSGLVLHSGFKNLPDAKVVALKVATEQNISTKVVRNQRQDMYTATVQARPEPVEDNNP